MLLCAHLICLNALTSDSLLGRPNNQFAKLPATNAIIERVHKLAGNNDMLTILSQHFEEEDSHDGFAPGVTVDPDVTGVSKDEVIEEQDQKPQDELWDNAGNPEHEIARVLSEEANEEINIERPNVWHPQLE